MMIPIVVPYIIAVNKGSFMKINFLAYVIGLSLTFGAQAKEAVAFVTHKVILNDKGEVSSVVPVKSEIVVPEGSNMSMKEHQDRMMKAVDLHMKKPDTLFSISEVFNKAIDKTVNVVSNPTFQKIATGVVAVGAAAAGAGAYIKNKKDNEQNDDLFYSCVAKTSSVNDCASKYNVTLQKK